MGDPNEPGRMSVTVKQDGREGTWIVFHGSAAEVRSQIVETFDMEGQDDAPLYDLINEATRIYKTTGNVTSGLGGRVLTGRKAEETPTGGGSAWDRVNGSTGSPAEPEVDPNIVRLEKAIEAATDRPALKELYARNKPIFDANPELEAAWKAKGKSLPK